MLALKKGFDQILVSEGDLLPTEKKVRWVSMWLLVLVLMLMPPPPLLLLLLPLPKIAVVVPEVEIMSQTCGQE
jgi:hypothetical protein